MLITQMFAAVDPIPLVLAFWGSSFPTMFFGGVLIRLGFAGLLRGSYPLTETKDITGLPARIAAFIVILFGAVVVLTGVATLLFCTWRMYQLLTK